MRVALIGHRGMLGSHVELELVSNGYEVFYKPSCSILDYQRMETFMSHCDFIINCAGVVHSKSNATRARMIEANAFGPHVLARFQLPMLHVSTDCVFNGELERGKSYHSFDTPDAIDDYGRTKALGEVDASYVCNVRTSFVGFAHGLLRWLMDNSDRPHIVGWTNAYWSGSTVSEVARALVNMIPNVYSGEFSGPIHLATSIPISKFTVLQHMRDILGLETRIVAENYNRINRSLHPTVLLPDFTTLRSL